MTVTELRKTKRGRISVYVDGEFATVLHPEVAAQSGLKAGAETSPEKLGRLVEESLFRMAKEDALRLLDYRAYPKGQLAAKLVEKKYPPEVARQAVDRMEELGLVDDRQYAEAFARELAETRHASRRMIREKLMQKGVDRLLIDEALEGLEFSEEEELAELVRKKYLSRLGEDEGERKVIAALARRGYPYGMIRRVLAALAEEEA